MDLPFGKWSAILRQNFGFRHRRVRIFFSVHVQIHFCTLAFEQSIRRCVLGVE